MINIDLQMMDICLQILFERDKTDTLQYMIDRDQSRCYERKQGLKAEGVIPCCCEIHSSARQACSSHCNLENRETAMLSKLCKTKVLLYAIIT